MIKQKELQYSNWESEVCLSILRPCSYNRLLSTVPKQEFAWDCHHWLSGKQKPKAWFVDLLISAVSIQAVPKHCCNAHPLTNFLKTHPLVSTNSLACYCFTGSSFLSEKIGTTNLFMQELRLSRSASFVVWLSSASHRLMDLNIWSPLAGSV